MILFVKQASRVGNESIWGATETNRLESLMCNASRKTFINF